MVCDDVALKQCYGVCAATVEGVRAAGPGRGCVGCAARGAGARGRRRPAPPAALKAGRAESSGDGAARVRLVRGRGRPEWCCGQRRRAACRVHLCYSRVSGRLPGGSARDATSPLLASEVYLWAGSCVVHLPTLSVAPTTPRGRGGDNPWVARRQRAVTQRSSVVSRLPLPYLRLLFSRILAIASPKCIYD